MVEVMGTLFILSYGETSAFLNALLERFSYFLMEKQVHS
jgi:hypothetical protein